MEVENPRLASGAGEDETALGCSCGSADVPAFCRASAAGSCRRKTGGPAAEASKGDEDCATQFRLHRGKRFGMQKQILEAAEAGVA